MKVYLELETVKVNDDEFEIVLPQFVEDQKLKVRVKN